MKPLNDIIDLNEGTLKPDLQDLFKRKNKAHFLDIVDNGKDFILDLKAGGKKFSTKGIADTDEWKNNLRPRLAGASNEDDPKFNMPDWRSTWAKLTGVAISKIDKIANDFSTKSGKGPSGAEWEALIALGFEALAGRDPEDHASEWQTAGKFWDEWEDQAIGIAKDLKKQGAPFNKVDRLQNVGSGLGSIKLNPKWLGSNKTPKTDLMTPSGKVKISLKKKGGSQLMSAKKEEAMSTAIAALENLSKNSKTRNELEKLADDMGEKMVQMEVPGEMGDLRGRIDDKQLQKDIAQADKYTVELNTDIEKYINNNKEFKSYFCWEAATGEFKFDQAITAIANSIVVFSESGKIEKTLILDNALSAGSALANKNDFYVSFKTSSKKSKSYLAFRSRGRSAKRGALSDSTEIIKVPTLSAIIREELESSLQLNENLWSILEAEQLNEFELLNKLTSTARKIGSSVYNKVKEVIKSIQVRMKAALNQLKQLGGAFFQAVLGFFGVEIGQVRVSNGGINI